MKFYKYIILFSLIHLITSGQIDSGRIYHNELKYKQAERFVENQLKKNKYKNDAMGKARDCYNLACTYSLLNKYDKCIEYLKKAVKIDTINYDAYFIDPDFYNISHTSIWNNFLIERKNKYQIKLADTVFINLIKISIQDQALFNEIDFYEKKSGIKSSKVLVYWKLKDSLNKENLRYIEYYLSQNINVLSDSVVGRKIASRCFLVIQHSNYQTMEKFLPIIKELYENKQASGSSYALLYDRVSLYKNKGIQFFGTQVNTETNQPYEIKDEKNVDKRRMELGMGSLRDYLLSMNIIYNPKRKK